MNVFVCVVWFFSFTHTLILANDAKGYDLPLLPLSLPPVPPVQPGYDKQIPRDIWIAVKDEKDALPGHMLSLFERNPLWTKHICDNKCKEAFMNQTFSGTSLNWAFHIINPVLGAARADIWRYCVLYTFGGFYIDDDSDIRTPLDQVVEPGDHMLMSEEGASSLGDCYIPSYHLSDKHTFKVYTNSSSAAHYTGIDNATNTPVFFHGHTLVNWGIFVKPRHPIVLRTLTHIVEVLKSEYLRRTVMMMTRWDVKWKMVMCSTNFVMTYTIREYLLENAPGTLVPRIMVNNFAKYGGRVKAIWTGGDPNHYMKAMQRKNGPHLLREHAPVTLQSTIEYLEGRVVMGDAGKEIFLIGNGTRHMFQDFETFVKMNFELNQVKHVKDVVLTAIPLGDDMPSLMVKS